MLRPFLRNAHGDVDRPIRVQRLRRRVANRLIGLHQIVVLAALVIELQLHAVEIEGIGARRLAHLVSRDGDVRSGALLVGISPLVEAAVEVPGQRLRLRRRIPLQAALALQIRSPHGNHNEEDGKQK
jgi:hypothetical protein